MLTAAAILMASLAGGDVPLDEILAREGLAVEVDPATGVRTIGAVRFAPGMSVALIDGVPLRLSAPVRVEGGRIWLPGELAGRLMTDRPKPAVEPAPASPPAPPAARTLRPGFKVCLDPGHGGSYNGCVGASGRVHEKTLALSISLELAQALRAAGAEVVLTRATDKQLSENYYKDLQARVDAADKCDAFVSVHLNWNQQRDVRGFEVYVARAASDASKKLARGIQTELRQAASTIDRGVREAGFYVLKHASCPAVLVELEFISNPDGERDMMTPSHRLRVARALADAIIDYAKSRGH